MVKGLKSRAMKNGLSKKSKKKKKKKKKGNGFLDFLGYLVFRLLVGILSFFPVEKCLKFGKFLGDQLWIRYHRGRKRALNNLRASYPEKDDEWYKKIGRRSFQCLGMLPVDLIFTPKLVRKDNWQEYAEFKNVERIKWMMKEKKGLILLTGHYGNFEILGYLMALFGFDIYSVARPLDNKFINDYLYKIRQKKGQKIIDKKGASTLMPEILESGATLGFIADQDAGRKGIFVDFFGRKASTYKSIGLLALTNDLPIGIGYSRRIDDKFKFELCCNRIIMPEEWKDKDDPLYWITQEYSKAIEDFVREDPTQYWWLHRRWKHRPKEEQEKESA